MSLEGGVGLPHLSDLGANEFDLALGKRTGSGQNQAAAAVHPHQEDSLGQWRRGDRCHGLRLHRGRRHLRSGFEPGKLASNDGSNGLRPDSGGAPRS